MCRHYFLLLLLFLSLASGASGKVHRVGSCWPSGSGAYPDLSSCLAACSEGDEVWVCGGVYRERSEVTIPARVSVYGGFTGSETALSGRDYSKTLTILDGSGAHRVATVYGLLDGFTLRNGRTGDNGGGVLVKRGGVVDHCIAFANEAGYDGGGIFAEDGSTVRNTLVNENRAGNDGSALGGSGSFRTVGLTVVNNIFTGVPEIKTVLPIPASLPAGGQLNLTEPDITDPDEVDPQGSTILVKGWELGGHAISMPYTVAYADNGKKLRFWAANAVGVGVSNEVTLTVTWTVTSSAQLLTPRAVCEGTTLAGAGITEPTVSPRPEGGDATCTWWIDGNPVSGLDYQLQYSDNGKLLKCEVKNADGTITGATTPAVRLAVMKALEVLLAAVPALSIEEGQPLCLPAPVVISNGADVTTQGWKWTTDGGTTLHAFNSCDKATTAMNGATVCYTAENGCSKHPTEAAYTTLTVTNPVSEFLQTVSALCAGMTLEEGISFNDGGNTGDYYIGSKYIGKPAGEGRFTTSWDDVKTQALATAHNLQVLRFSYNGGRSERRITLTVHPVPEVTTDPVTPAALCFGDVHTLTAGATGDNLAWQWERSTNSTNGLDGTWDNVPGSTTAACRLTADVTAYYRCAVTGVCIDKSPGVSGGKIISAAAKLTVNDRPVIPDVSFTAGELKICAGSEISTILAAKTPTLTGTPAGSEGWTLGGVKIAGDYKVLPTDNGKALGYRASNGCGERTATFPTGILSVTSRPELLQPPADVTTEENSSVRLSVLTGGGVRYEWYKAGTVPDDPANGATLIPSATASSWSFTAEELKGTDLIAGKKETEYYCKIIAATGVCKGNNADPAINPTDPAYVLSDVAKVTVTRRTTGIILTSQPEAFPETCDGTDKSISVTATGRGGLTCTWYSGSTPVTDPTNGTITTTVKDITPAPGDPLAADKELTSAFIPNAAGTYYCIIASTDNPGGVRSTQSVLTIHALPVLTDIPAEEQAQTLCEGTDLSVRVSATGVGITYGWQKSTDRGASYTTLGETDSRLRTAITGDALYRCVVKATCAEKAAGYDASAGGLISSAVTVTAAAKPAIAPAAGFTPAAFSKCEGEAIDLSDDNLTITDNHKDVAPANRWWTLGGQQVENTRAVSRNDNGKTVGYSAANECGTTAVTFAAMKLTVDEKPQVTQDPVGVQTVEDSRVRLSVSASGSDLTYQWQKKAHTDPDIAASWQNIAGGTNAVYSFTADNITAGAFDGAGVLTDYRCVIGTTNACAATTVTSAAATVTVTRSRAAVSIRRQPAAYEVCSSAASPYAPGFTVEVEGSGHFVYSWYEISDRSTPVAQTPASGSMTDAVADKTNTFMPSAAGTYYCFITSTDDAVGVQTQAVTLSISRAPVINGITPSSAAICAGGSVTLGVDAVGSALTYQWYQQTGGTPNPDADTKKGTAPTFTPVGLAATATFYCVVGSGSVCTATATSDAVEVTVQQAPKITVQPVSQSVCGSTGISLNVTATGADTYQWYHNGTATGSNSATLGNVTDGGVYTCVVSEAGGVCGEVTSVPALVTVAGAPEVSLGTASGLTACRGDLVTLPAPVVEANGSLIVAGGTGWYLSTEPDPIAAAVVASSLVDNTVTYNYKITYRCSESDPSSTTLTGAMPQFTVTMAPEPAVSGNLQEVVKNAGETVSEADVVTALTPTHGTPQWLLAGTPVTLPYTATAVDNGKRFSCVVTNACGQAVTLGDDVSGRLTVNSLEIVTHPSSATACEGAAVTLDITTKNATGFQWYKDGVKHGSRTDNATNANTLTLNNVTAADGGVYTCEVYGAGGLTLMSSPAVVTVNARPSVVTTAETVTVCAGSPLTLQCEAGGAGLTYEWKKDASAVLGTSSSLTLASAAAGSYVCTVAGTCTPAVTKTITLTVPDAPVKPTFATRSSATTTCEGDEVTLPNVGYKAATGRWELNGVPKGNITKYKVHAADNGQVFRYVNINACGQETTSAATYTLRVKQPARITSKLTTPTIIKAGTALSSVVTVPTSANMVTDGWTLNGVKKLLTDAVAMTDHAANLTYTVDNGCAERNGSGNTDEATTLLTVWKEPVITTPESEKLVTLCKGAQVGPLTVTYDAGNCEVIPQWSYGDAKTTITETSNVVLDMQGQLLYCRLRRKAPDGTTDYTTWKKLGRLSIHTAPTLSDLSAPKPGTPEVWYAGAFLGKDVAHITDDGGLRVCLQYTIAEKFVAPDLHTLLTGERGQTLKVRASNTCGTVVKELLLEFPTLFDKDIEFRTDNKYFAGIKNYSVIKTSDVIGDGLVIRVDKYKVKLEKKTEKTWLKWAAFCEQPTTDPIMGTLRHGSNMSAEARDKILEVLWKQTTFGWADRMVWTAEWAGDVSDVSWAELKGSLNWVYHWHDRQKHDKLLAAWYVSWWN